MPVAFYKNLLKTEDQNRSTIKMWILFLNLLGSFKFKIFPLCLIQIMSCMISYITSTTAGNTSAFVQMPGAHTATV